MIHARHVACVMLGISANAACALDSRGRSSGAGDFDGSGAAPGAPSSGVGAQGGDGTGGIAGTGGSTGGGGVIDCPGPAWSAQFGGAFTDYAAAVAVDANGDVYLTGRFRDTIDFGGPELTSAGGEDIFVVKLDRSGTHVWSHAYGDASDQVGSGIAVTSKGHVLVTGAMEGTVDFGSGAKTSAGFGDVFVLRLDTDGNHMWDERYGGFASDAGLAIAATSDGDAIVVGGYEETMSFGDADLLWAGTSAQAFIARLDGAGKLVWAEGYGGPYSDVARAVAVDAFDDVVVAGDFASSALDFGGGPLASSGDDDIFVAKIHADHHHLWSKRFGDEFDQDGLAIAVDANGSVWISGRFLGHVDFGGGSLGANGDDDTFVAKLASNGDHAWSAGFGDDAAQEGRALAVDQNGNLVVAGTFAGSIDFGGGALVASGDVDAFVARLDAAGNHLSSARFGDTDIQFARAVAADACGTIVAVGGFLSTLDFGTGQLVSAGASDVFVARVAR